MISSFFRTTYSRLKHANPLLLFVAFFSCAVISQTIFPATAMAQTVDDQTNVYQGSDDDGCDVGFVGWLICGVSNLLAKFTDGMFRILEYLLYVEPLTRSSEGGSQLYRIWNSFRSVANVIFIILFLVVIWSHVTGAGISSYSIQRILPRLIVNVILINASYYIGVIIVDISNVAGNSIKAVLDTIASQIGAAPNLSTASSIIAMALAGIAVVGSAVAVSFFGMAALGAAIMPMMVAAIITLLTIIFILIARQVIIVALIIISPIAFALNVLPNTQKWFSKWWSALFVASMAYPIIGFMFGAGSIAGNIILSGVGGSGTLTAIVLAILGLAAQVMPMIMVPKLIKNSTGALAGIANAAEKISRGVMKPAADSSKLFQQKKSMERQINNLNSGGMRGAIAQAKARGKYWQRKTERELGHGDSKTGSTALDRFESDNVAKIAHAGAAGIIDKDKRARREAQISDMMQARILELEIADIDAAEVVIKENEWSIAEQQAMFSDPNTHRHTRAAIARNLGKSGNEDVIGNAMQQIQDMTGDTSVLRTLLSQGVTASGIGGRAAHLNQESMQTYKSDASASESGNVADNLRVRSAEKGHYTPVQLARESKGSISRLEHLSHTGGISPQAAQSLSKSKAKIESSSSLGSSMGGAAKQKLSQTDFRPPTRPST